MAKRKAITRIVRRVSEGVFAHATDLMLFTLFLIPAGIGATKTSLGALRSLERATQMLGEFNYMTMKRAIRRLREKGWLRGDLRVTKSGQERIEGFLPLYAFRERGQAWDGRWRLVIFDVPEKIRKIREALRGLLERLSFAQLQKSVWISPRRYLGDVKDFVERHDLVSYVIFAESDAVGREGSYALAERLWMLENLNAQYRDLVRRKGSVFQYLYLLRRDPFMPSELLPSPWYGEDAHERFLSLLPPS